MATVEGNWVDVAGVPYAILELPLAELLPGLIASCWRTLCPVPGLVSVSTIAPFPPAKHTYLNSLHLIIMQF